MHRAQYVVPITEFRANMASLLEDCTKAGIPVFITQNGYVTSVVMSRSQYDELVEACDPGGQASDSSMIPNGPARDASHPSCSRSAGSSAVKRRRRRSSAGEILDAFLGQPRTIDSRWGRIDQDLADFFDEAGVDWRKRELP